MLLMHRVNIVKQGKQGQTMPRIDDVKCGHLIRRQTCLPLVPDGSQHIGLLPIDSHVDSGYPRCNRMGIGHGLFRCVIQCSNRDNEPVMDVLWMERKRGDTFTLNELVMAANSRKQQHQHWDQHHDDPGPI